MYIEGNQSLTHTTHCRQPIIDANHCSSNPCRQTVLDASNASSHANSQPLAGDQSLQASNSRCKLKLAANQ